MPARLPDFPTLLTHSLPYDVRRVLYSYLPPADLLALSNTCKQLSWLLRSEVWNVNALLSRYVRQPLAFRRLMALHDVVVSGSAALQLFEGVYWEQSDLDVYIKAGDGQAIVELLEYLISEESYEIVPFPWQTMSDRSARELVDSQLRVDFGKEIFKVRQENIDDDGTVDPVEGFYEMTNITGVFQLERTTSPTRKIQLIAAKKHPIASIINDFYCTAIVNWFTFDKAYSLFPYLTFKKRISAVTHPLTEKLAGCLEKYATRGYIYSNALDTEERPRGLIPTRLMGDPKYTWTIPLNTDGIDMTDIHPVPAYVIDYSYFSISWDCHRLNHEGGWLSTDEHYRMQCLPFTSAVLKHTYLYASGNPDGTEGSWLAEFGARCTKAIRVASLLFEDEDVRRLSGSEYFEWDVQFPEPLPAGFSYADDEVEGWHRIWEKGEGLLATEQDLVKESDREPEDAGSSENGRETWIGPWYGDQTFWEAADSE